MIFPIKSLRALGLALLLALPLSAAPSPALRFPQVGDPTVWNSFQDTLSYLEHWVGRDLPDWVVHSTLFQYPSRRPVYGRDGNPVLDDQGRPVTVTFQASGRAFFPPAWRLSRRPRLPLVLYPHATMLKKDEAPSRFGGHEWLFAAAAAAYYGFAVAMPDQGGMGGDALDYHPFCHAKSLAWSTLDALAATTGTAGCSCWATRRAATPPWPRPGNWRPGPATIRVPSPWPVRPAWPVRSTSPGPSGGP